MTLGATDAGTPPNPSFWIQTTPDTDYPPLEGSVDVDVAVIGAGIAGLTAAALLRREGRTVAVVESKRIVQGATGYTTAKLTSGHGVIYSQLESSLGTDAARTYAESNEAALERVARFVQEDGIECDFERKANYVYAESEDDLEEIREEAEAAARAGLHVSFVEDVPLPYAVAGAVRLENQAQFHPRKYLLALAEQIPGDGSDVFELTTATNVSDGEPCEIETDRGSLRARHVIIATHLPFIDRGLFFAKAHPHRSYAVAAPIDASATPDGMFVNSGTPTRSVRVMRDGDRTYVQVGGEGHKPGADEETPKRYRTLEEFLHRHWPDAGDVEHRWSTQDYMSVDHVPYIGRLRRGWDRVLTATGFNKWGMTSGTLAAMLLTDRILGRDNAWSELYDAKRLNPKASLPKLVKENASVGAHFFADRLRRADADIDSLAPGEGAIVRLRGRKRAAYRDENGELHVYSPLCRHLYCHVRWNPAEKSWDCPCHGSRYAADGKVIEGPTVEPLKRIDS
jgi:glycine/D-amino acid oxidase-like deaminating enzyme/nitrite reductase/ring-hydroxylating ferredoxin subunit